MRVETIGDATLYLGDCRESMRAMEPESVQCVVTSPPYWGLRDYGVDGQIGLEATPEEYVATMVDVFREVRRVLRDDGTVWLNLGDSYNNFRVSTNGQRVHNREQRGKPPGRRAVSRKLKEKDLVGIPWRVAFALQADGWWLRQDIIWAKPNPMPESVTDRCTKAHEYLFLLSKAARYYYDAEAIKEPDSGQQHARTVYAGAGSLEPSGGLRSAHGNLWGDESKNGQGRNKRSVWTVATAPYAEAHFATFPPKLIEPCILAGSRAGDVVLDPFGGSGTTAGVALEHGRKAALCELSGEYGALVPDRIRSITDALDQGQLFKEQA
jgi:DNA modification methylase